MSLPALVVLSQIADALTWPIALSQPGRELGLASMVDPALALTVKLVAIVIVGLMAYRLQRHTRLLAVVAWVGILGAMSNLSALL